jgi:hypothetical protein
MHPFMSSAEGFPPQRAKAAQSSVQIIGADMDRVAFTLSPLKNRNFQATRQRIHLQKVKKIIQIKKYLG